jgi:chromosome segregation ATPase
LTKKAKNTIEQAETCQEQTELDIAIQQHHNAVSTVDQLSNEIEALQRRLEEIEAEAEHAKERAEQARQNCALAEQRLEECAERVLKARTRAMVATGTAEQAEKQAELDTAIRYLELAQKVREEAHRALDEAVKAHEQATSGQAILSEIERCKTEISEKLLLKNEFATVEAEAWQRVGREKARLTSARLDELQRHIDACEAQLREAKQAMDSELDRIDELRSHPELYHDLRKQYVPERLPRKTVTPRERVIDAYIAYIEVLAEHGSSLEFFDHKSKMSFCNSLDLNPSMLQGFFGYDHAFKQSRIDIAKSLPRRSDV